MAKLIWIPDKLIKKKSKTIQREEDVGELIDTLRTTIANIGYKGYGGISAVQIGTLKRIFVLKLPEKEIVAINPRVLKEFGGKSKSWELCFSVPGKVGRIKRYKKGEFEYLDMNLQKKSVTLKGKLARMFYHEIDHLNGVIFLDRINDKDTDLMNEEEYWKMRNKVSDK